MMFGMTQGSGLKTADRWEGNYRLLCGSLDFPWIMATGLGAQPPNAPLCERNKKATTYGRSKNNGLFL